MVHSAWIKAVRCHALAIWVGSRGVETLNSTHTTEGVLSLVSIEGIVSQAFLTLTM